MALFSFSSLRSRAIGLPLLAILPVLALTIYGYFHQRDREIREVQKHALTAAKNPGEVTGGHDRRYQKTPDELI
jgi:hypothetical protein